MQVIGIRYPKTEKAEAVVEPSPLPEVKKDKPKKSTKKSTKK